MTRGSPGAQARGADRAKLIFDGGANEFALVRHGVEHSGKARVDLEGDQVVRGGLSRHRGPGNLHAITPSTNGGLSNNYLLK